MITKKRVLLVVTNKNALNYYTRFEAIAEIHSTCEIESVWRKNKTPICSKEVFEKGGAHVPEGTHVILEIEHERFLDNAEEFIRFCHENGFESGEYRTGKIYDTSTERCFLCELARYKGMPSSLAYYNEHVEKPVDCIIYQSRQFYVVSELGAIKPGYVMIVPKKHILSVAQFPEGFMAEYQQVCSDVETILKGAYGKDKLVVFFEHGSGPSGMTSHKKSIVHAHTHVVIDFQIKQKYKDMVQMKPIKDISVVKNTHYFSYQETSSGQQMIAMDPEVYVQRQYPRQIMAEELGLAPGQYNWRNVEFAENVKAQLYNFYRYLVSDDETLNPRIIRRTEGFVKGYIAREDFPRM